MFKKPAWTAVALMSCISVATAQVTAPSGAPPRAPSTEINERIGQPQPGQPGRPGETTIGQGAGSRGTVTGQPARGVNVNVTQPAQTGQTTGRAAQASNTQLDQKIATCVILGGQSEIAMAEFAMDKVKHDDVKEFAEMMKKEHSEVNQKFARFAPNLGSQSLDADQPAAQNNRGAAQVQVQTPVVGVNVDRRTDNDRDGNRNDRTATVQAGPVQTVVTNRVPLANDDQMTAIERQIKQECLQMTRQELSDAGEHFDQAYLGQQLSAHLQMIAQLKVYEQHASAQLKPLVTEAREGAEKHLDHARKLMKDIGHSHDDNDKKAESDK